MIREDVNLYTMEPMKYQSLSSMMPKEERQNRINMLINTNNYIYSLKTDGNYGRMIWEDGEVVLQSRGISKKTGEYGCLEGKVLFSESFQDAFYDTTMLIGEIYLDGGVDKDVGSILRCLDDKAIARQKGDRVLKYRIFDCFYYNGTSLLNAPIMERIKYIKMAAEAINNPLVSYVKYYEAKPETFWDKLNAILENGGEGVVLYRKDMTPCEGRTPAGQTLKVKQELGCDVDAFIIGTEPATREYTGKELENWQYWLDGKTDEFLYGTHYTESLIGSNIIPVTKSYYKGWPGAIKCGVFDKNGNEVMLCKCANLTDELAQNLTDNYEEYHHKPCKIQGMMISRDKTGAISIRHPKLLEIRDDIDIKDCTLEKVIGG